jgi:Fe-S oxidoreductase
MALDGGVASVPHCCSEAGTLALSRPDIAAAMLARKRQSLSGGAGPIITNCPACLNGLGRQRNATAVHLAVAMADALDAGGWRQWVAGRLAGADRVRF